MGVSKPARCMGMGFIAALLLILLIIILIITEQFMVNMLSSPNHSSLAFMGLCL